MYMNVKSACQVHRSMMICENPYFLITPISYTQWMFSVHCKSLNDKQEVNQEENQWKVSK